MQIFRYRHYPQSDLSAALDRLTNMRAEMDRVFESTGSFSASTAPLSRWNPAVNVYQDQDRFTVVVELPGLKKEEIEISLYDDTLTIAGEGKREESSEQEFLTERLYGKFQRSLTLPTAVNAEKVKASYKGGLLQVELPKARIIAGAGGGGMNPQVLSGPDLSTVRQRSYSGMAGQS
jgi:HSP20 family protein